MAAALQYTFAGSVDIVLSGITVDDIRRSSRQDLAFRLRQFVKDYVQSWSLQQLVQFVVSSLLQEAAGTWQDQWSMVCVLLEFRSLEFLVGVNDVRGVRTEGDDLICFVVDGASTAYLEHRSVGGAVAMDLLRERVCLELCNSGNNHWANELDIHALSKCLNIGMYLFRNVLVSEDGRVVDRYQEDKTARIQSGG